MSLVIHQAVHAKLAEALAGVCAVYDHVPAIAAFPYVDIAAQLAQQTAAGELEEWCGFETTVFIGVVSDARSRLEVPAIVGRIAATFGSDLALADGGRGKCRIIEAQTLPDDNDTYRGAVTLQILTQER